MLKSNIKQDRRHFAINGGFSAMPFCFITGHLSVRKFNLKLKKPQDRQHRGLGNFHVTGICKISGSSPCVWSCL